MSDLSSSSEIELVAGARMDGLDFRIDAEKAFRVRGRVVRADGQPVNGPLSFHIRQDGATGNRAYLMLGEISESSEFELFNVPRGQTLVAVSSEDSGNGRLTGFIMSDVFDRDLDDIEVILQPGITLSGVVRSEGVEDGQVDPLWKEATAEVGVRIVPQGVLGVAGKGAAAVTRGTGRWLTDGVIPTWSAPVLTGLPPGYVVTALHYNGVSYNNGEMQLNPAAISHELRITVCRVSNSVTVEAFKDRKSPAAKAQVLLVSSGRYTGGDRRKILSAVADEAGRHTFSNLEPGKYCVAAVDASSDLGQAMRFVDEGRCNSVEVERTSNETIATTIR